MQRNTAIKISNFFFLLVLTSCSVVVVGLGIGWYTGLSQSPTVSSLIAALLALSTSIFFTNFGKEHKSRVLPLPLQSWLLILISCSTVLGSIIGLMAREGVSVNIHGKDIKPLISFNPSPINSEGTKKSYVLHGNHSSDCSVLLSTKPEHINVKLTQLNNSLWQEVLSLKLGKEKTHRMVELLCENQ